MNYETLAAHVFVPSETNMRLNKEMQMAHLRAMTSQMAQQIATKLVEEELVNIDMQYDIAKRGYHYSMSVRLWREHDES